MRNTLQEREYKPRVDPKPKFYPARLTSFKLGKPDIPTFDIVEPCASDCRETAQGVEEWKKRCGKCRRYKQIRKVRMSDLAPVKHGIQQS